MFVFRVSIRAKRMEIIFLSLDVHFVENEFPYFNGQLQKKDTAPLDQSLQEIIVEEPLENGSGLHLLHKTNSSSLDECTTTQPIASPTHDNGDTVLSDHTVNNPDPPTEESVLPVNQSSRREETTSSAYPPPLLAEVPLGRGHRMKTPSVRLRDFVAATTIPLSLSLQSSSPTKSSGVSFPIHDFVNCDSFSKHHRSFLASLHIEQEPLIFFSSGPRCSVA